MWFTCKGTVLWSCDKPVIDKNLGHHCRLSWDVGMALGDKWYTNQLMNFESRITK